MAIRIFNNLASQAAQRLLGGNNDRLARSLERVASGIRITQSSDDAAGLSISESLRSDTRALKQGVRNLTDGQTLINVAEGALAEQTGILIRLREISAQAATGTVGQTERNTIQLEFNQLRNEFDRISATTEFNGIKLLDGSLSASAVRKLEIQIGLNSGTSNRIDLNQELNIEPVTSSNLGLNTLSVLTQTDAVNALANMNTSINQVSITRAKIGALQNRMDRALDSITVSIENLTSAESQIRDADLAEELTNLTRDQILVNSATAMVGQANLLPTGVFRLIEEI